MRIWCLAGPDILLCGVWLVQISCCVVFDWSRYLVVWCLAGPDILLCVVWLVQISCCTHTYIHTPPPMSSSGTFCQYCSAPNSAHVQVLRSHVAHGPPTPTPNPRPLTPTPCRCCGDMWHMDLSYFAFSQVRCSGRRRSSRRS